MIIQWKNGSKLTGSAEPVYNEIEKIRKKHGHVTARLVLDKAESSRSPLHRHFEWDDKKAAEAHRLDKARYVLRSIETIHVEAPNMPVKTYSSVTVASKEIGGEPKRAYQSTEEAMKDPIQRDEILGNAIRDAISFRRKYAALQELSQIFHAVDDLVENFK